MDSSQFSAQTDDDLTTGDFGTTTIGENNYIFTVIELLCKYSGVTQKN